MQRLADYKNPSLRIHAMTLFALEPLLNLHNPHACDLLEKTEAVETYDANLKYNVYEIFFRLRIDTLFDP